MRGRRSRTAAIAVFTVGALVLTGCGASAEGDAGSRTLTVGATSAVRSWDPAYIGDSNEIPYAQAAYDTLIRRTDADEYVPMLAESWEFSEDGKQITLILREDVTFSDGEAFNAEAVKVNAEHFSSSAGPLGSQLAGFAGATVVDEYTVSLQFEEAIPDLLYNLSDAAGRMASPAAIGTGGLATVPVGTGPYILEEGDTVQGSTYTLSKREGYWDSDLQKFDEVVFKIFPQETGLLNAIRSGQVDAGNLSDQDNIQNAKAAGIEILNPEYHLAWAGIIFYDRAGEIIPQLADSRVRRAIAHAIDGEGVLETAFLNEGTINNQIFNESSPAYETGANDTYSYDPELAKQLMAEAGYADGFKSPNALGGSAPALDPDSRSERTRGDQHRSRLAGNDGRIALP